MACRDRQPCFIVGITTIIIGQILIVIVFIRLKEVFRIFFPCTEMILIENDEIPVGRMYPFILGLDTASVLINTEEVLERTEADDRSVFTGVLILNIRIRFAWG